MNQTISQLDQNEVYLALTSVIVIALLVAIVPLVSGLAIQTWLGIVAGLALVTRLLLHWRWLVNNTRG